MKITIVAGARPNFMKVAPIIKAISSAQKDGKNIEYRLIHTGQHYDKKMSGDFFEQLGIPSPDANLECGSGTAAEQTGSIMKNFENELQHNNTDIVLVVGDVTSTMACAITAKKMNIKTAHVEAGIRSGDMKMPEEINRIVTDSICDLYFTTSKVASKNLLLQNVDSGNIHMVGNTMIDTLLQNIEKIKKPDFWDGQQLKEKKYFILTLHRPSNVDDPTKLKDILNAIQTTSADHQIIFPIHPRTLKSLTTLNYDSNIIRTVDPQAYHEFIYLIKNAKGIITDSGGITEEATLLNIPCITLRDTTERPETVDIGTNELAGEDKNRLQFLMKKIINNDWKIGGIPENWDGKTSERIVDILLEKHISNN
jgi:UDP-N-acetylglucosamine 2-epimerase (non-hydrolysing)